MNDFLRTVLFLPEQASTVAFQIDRLHYFVIITTMIASTLVGMTALFFFVRYRRRSEDQRTPVIKPTILIESIFIGLPLAFFLTWFVIGFGQFVRLQTPPEDAMDVYVMGKQWMWKFSYPEGPNAISTLRVPAGRPVRLLITSRDVIHSFYVPAFRIKQDALPGRYTQVWFEAIKPGRYEILCTEYCGLSHSEMRGDVVVLEASEFDRWQEDQRRGIAERQDSRPAAREGRPLFTDLAAQGERVAAEIGCLKCHSLDGSPHIGPTWLDLYGRRELLASGRSVVVDEAYLTRSMMDPQADVVHGFDPVMPPFQGRLSATETAALVEFIRSLRSDARPRDSFEEDLHDLAE